MNTAPLKEGASVTLWLTYQLLYLLSVDQVSVESQSIYWLSGVLLWVDYQLTDWPSVSHNSNGSVLAMRVLVSRWSSSSEVLNGDVSVESQHHLYNLTPNAFPFVTRHLSDDTQKTLFAHYTYRPWLIPDWSVTPNCGLFSCIGQHLCHLLVDISVALNNSRPRYWSLCQLSVGDLLVIRRRSNDWLLTDCWPMDYSGWLLVETCSRLD